MIGDFDRAFLKKVKAVWPNTIYANTAVTYNAVYSGGAASTETAKLSFPLINIYRTDGYGLLKNQTIAARLQGITNLIVNKEDSDTNVSEKYKPQVRFLLARVAYQLNVFAKTLEELDQIISDLIIFFSLESTLEVEQVSKDKKWAYTEVYDLDYVRGPIEQSNFVNEDRIYTQAIVYEIPAAKLANFIEVPTVRETKVDINIKDHFISIEDKIEK